MSSPVVSAKNKILKGRQFSLGTATAISLSQTNMSTLKDARTLLLESYLDVVNVIDDDEFILLNDETSPRTRKFHMKFFYICNNDFKIQEYRNNTLKSSSATSTLLMSVSIPLALSSFFNLLLGSLARL